MNSTNHFKHIMGNTISEGLFNFLAVLRQSIVEHMKWDVTVYFQQKIWPCTWKVSSCMY